MTFTGKITMPQQTCGNCKHWELFPRIVAEVLGSNWDNRGVCNGELAEFIDGGGSGIDFAPPEEFGCKKWEEKV